MRVVIIGGVAGGMSAATRLRRLDESAEIIVLERSGHVSYANCGLPYYVGGVIAEEDKLYLQTPESLHKRFRLDVRVHHEVTGISSSKKVVIARDLITGAETEISYDKLILSPGASPVIPPIPGIERALTLRTVEDVLRIYDAFDRHRGDQGSHGCDRAGRDRAHVFPRGKGGRHDVFVGYGPLFTDGGRAGFEDAEGKDFPGVGGVQQGGFGWHCRPAALVGYGTALNPG